MQYGAAIERSALLSLDVENILRRLTVMSFEPPVDQGYAELRAAPDVLGRPLAANGLLIAARAIALDCVLVTDDRAFERVPDLVVENRLQRGSDNGPVGFRGPEDFQKAHEAWTCLSCRRLA